MENQNIEQKDLPKPLTDLPLPEKEIPEHLASQGWTLQGYRKLPFPKYVFLGIVFVILFAIVGGAYFLGKNAVYKQINPTVPAIPSPDEPAYQSPTPVDETSNWKTYTNTDIGYSIKYPADSYINCGKDELSLDEGTICAAGEGGPTITVSTNPKPTNYELSEYPNCYRVAKETISLAGTIATKYTSIPQPGPNGELPKSECNKNSVAFAQNNAEINIALQNGKNTYVLTVHGTFVDEKTTELRNKIISTFKFTN